MPLSSRFGQQRIAPQLGGPGIAMKVNAPGGGPTPPPVPQPPMEEEQPGMDMSQLGGLLGMLAQQKGAEKTNPVTFAQEGTEPNMIFAQDGTEPNMWNKINPFPFLMQGFQSGAMGGVGR